jgi:4-hydroxyphenylacetate 3-monooxygenase oxygenase component
MGASTGAQYIERLRDGRELYVNGQRVDDVTAYPPYRGVIAELAAHYDRHHDAALAPVLTFPSPADGKPVSNSFLEVREWTDMEARLRGERARAEFTYGLMGRLPDFMNAFVTDIATIAPGLGKFADNALRYHARCRDEDLALTHTLADPQVDRSRGVEAQGAVHIVRETDAGIVVRGARMLATLAPVSHEVLVGAFMPRSPGEERYAVAFATPIATPGLKLVCREPYDAGRSRFDRPLSSRFDEGDAVVVFDDALIPWERVFAAGDLAAYGTLLPVFMPGYLMLQAVIRGATKLQLYAGIAMEVAQTVGRAHLPRYQELIGELIGYCEMAEALIEATARQVYDNVRGNPEPELPAPVAAFMERALCKPLPRGMAAFTAIRFLYPLALERAREALHLAGSSGLVMTPTEADFANPAVAGVLEEYLRGRDTPAQRRVQVMKLAWDAIATEFGARQALYEQFFAGDPIFGRMIFYQTPRAQLAQALAQRLLAQTDAPGTAR